MNSVTDIFYINWQEPETRRWFVVGQLIRKHHGYLYQYTFGALKSARFKPFASLGDLRSVYISQTLFPIFANRMMNKSRPEYDRYAAWSGMASNEVFDPLLLMALMGGGRATDTLQVFKKPTRSPSGGYSATFFCHGIRHMTEGAQLRVANFDDGERLYPMFDVQNEFDSEAVALRTRDPAALVGYCPRYIAKDMRSLGAQASAQLNIRVRRTNHDAPPQFRLLLEAVARWPVGFQSCDADECKPIAETDTDYLLARYAMRNAARPGGQRD